MRLQDAIDMATASGRMMFAVIGAMARFEAELARERTISGIAAAKCVLVRRTRRLESVIESSSMTSCGHGSSACPPGELRRKPRQPRALGLHPQNPRLCSGPWTLRSPPARRSSSP